MIKTNCKAVQSQLDELNLDDDLSPLTVAHLRECESCRDFQQKQSGLRRLVGSLGTVQAPADFDFRLRARLAQGQAAPNLFSRSLNRSAVTAAAILLFVAGALMVGYLQVNRSASPVVAQDNRKDEPTLKVEPVPSINPNRAAIEQTAGVVNQTSGQKRTNLSAPVLTNKPKRTIVAADFSGTQATTFGPGNSVAGSPVFPIDASMQSMKVSLDDGRGNARTISLPGVSFGSHRVLANGNQFAPKDIW